MNLPTSLDGMSLHLTFGTTVTTVSSHPTQRVSQAARSTTKRRRAQRPPAVARLEFKVAGGQSCRARSSFPGAPRAFAGGGTCHKASGPGKTRQGRPAPQPITALGIHPAVAAARLFHSAQVRSSPTTQQSKNRCRKLHTRHFVLALRTVLRASASGWSGSPVDSRRLHFVLCSHAHNTSYIIRTWHAASHTHSKDAVALVSPLFLSPLTPVFHTYTKYGARRDPSLFSAAVEPAVTRPAGPARTETWITTLNHPCPHDPGFVIWGRGVAESGQRARNRVPVSPVSRIRLLSQLHGSRPMALPGSHPVGRDCGCSGRD